MGILEIKGLHAGIEGKEILKGVNLSAKQGEVHAIMGPNGSGKSTLSSVIMGHPKYAVTKGDVLFNGKSVLGMPADERAKMGLFMSFQYPFEISGLTFGRFLYATYKARNPLNTMSIIQFRQKVKEAAKSLKMGEDFIERELNVGFSGGEKKRAEILQMLLLKPKIAIMDETDSGLDIDSLKLVSETVSGMRSKDFGALVITHYKRILTHLKPDFVHIMHDGRIIKSGGHQIAEELEEKGYTEIIKEFGHEAKGAE
ncbi:MAG: Fe-S cluster assembly ATPase SufC [Candidatus Diapherotrites archaeon]|uniref:Fe-S cluster assembly ATPase SufC n=1 Tax=Candidatus Iainarchaeum sp. TaxID=3101447 RepID=A0A8T3YL47_9ARCH|nr:Fe-S cluster assembly ATPase SufC [Candidatus Diapherotrites archaeon]